MEILISIVANSIIPIFLLIGLGFLLGRAFRPDINALTKVNFYLFVPAFSFVNIYSTDITAGLARVILLAAAALAVNFAAGAGLARLLKLPPKTAKAFENSLMFCNSGNIGVSLITFVFTNPPFASGGEAPLLEAALSVQIMTLLVQNLSVNTLGFINSGGDGMTLKKGVLRVMKMPTLYAVACAVLLNRLSVDITATPFWPALEHLRAGLVPIALTTLGVQLAQTLLELKRKTVYLAVFCRLIGGPALGLLLISLFGLEGVMAQAAFIASSTPTAVNVALLSIECKGDVDFAVQTVTVSTLLSAATLTASVYLAYIIF